MQNAYSVARCSECGGLGTIVSLGKCCAIAALAAIDARNPERFAPFPNRRPEPHAIPNSRRLPDAENGG
jgi:hypothetical protein